MKHSQILREAKELISTPTGWTKGSYARDKNGAVILILGLESIPKEATCFCGVGAVVATAVKHGIKDSDMGLKTEPSSYLYRVVSADPSSPIHTARDTKIFRDFTGFNDRETTSLAEVLSAFDRAIALAESEGN